MWRHDFSILCDVHSQHVKLQEESLPWCLSVIELSAWPLFISSVIKYDKDKFGVVFRDAKRPVRFSLEDKHVVKEHRAVRKSHYATQEKCPHVVHFNVPRESFEPRGIKNGRKIRGCRGLLGVVIP